MNKDDYKKQFETRGFFKIEKFIDKDNVDKIYLKLSLLKMQIFILIEIIG